ncbi:hypothetical protein ARMGADRAFT_1035415 [Armillaria gallica]|uniref:Uncharacterized protein n=1 Tax=Armillaria gallica TaxID=47427 RepID=A0A2H3DGG6_ARMGA|nr:hypothetical protein ARMGADRAFT_1035415 [Armillaria gallica]
MRFSVAALLPLALAVPALSASVQARDSSYGGVDHKDDGKKDSGNKDYGKEQGQWSWRLHLGAGGWNKGKYTPYDNKEVDKITFEIECKSFCEKDDKCNSYQGYSHDEKDDKDYGKDDKDYKDGKKDDKKYYDTSAWNAHYGWRLTFPRLDFPFLNHRQTLAKFYESTMAQARSLFFGAKKADTEIAIIRRLLHTNQNVVCCEMPGSFIHLLDKEEIR